MSAPRQILVGTDGSQPATNAVFWAVDEAARHALELRIVTAHEPWYDLYSASTELKDAEERELRSELQKAKELALQRQPELQVRTDLLSGGAAEVLGEQSERVHAVVTGTRGRGGFPGLVLGSTSMDLIGQARAPVIIVPGGELPTGGGVVVGIDGSAHSQSALRFAFQQAQARQARLTAVWVIQEPSWYGPPGAYTQWLASAAGTTEEHLVEELGPWREKYPDVDVAGTVMWGHPVAMLRRAAEEAELLIVGSRGRNIARSLLLGSVSHGVLHHAPCPVAIVR